MKKLLLISLVLLPFACKTPQQVVEQTPVPAAAPENPVPEVIPQEVQLPDRGPYRAEKTKDHDLIHTKLEVQFDWGKQHLLGKATLELQPYFYPQDQLLLDAKGFDIHSVRLLEGDKQKDLTYHYDQKQIRIELDRVYARNEHFFVAIDYTAKPNELDAGGSAAITSDKGLYFINPLGAEEGKPQQIWTQGETEANSCWFPTIDSPNQSTTQEIYITVQEKFTTLSNGALAYSRSNGDGTRTDYWKMDQPHAPYLFMMAVGEYAVVKEQWEGKDVSYYVEPEYEKYAKDIFGNTLDMLSYFSELLDYPYPWSKYAQVVVRDYVSGAMENTTASVFMEALQVDDRYLLDDDWDGIIAHELFHQWFGDLVTCESWANLPLNEAFANYSEYLWAEHRLGRDEADYLGYEEQLNYLAESKHKQVDLIRFYYDDKEDMFDSHSYAKGGRILHMLRHVVGDDAFFTALQDYLKSNAYQPVEVHHLRLAFEKVSGRDLNWFFNQWFLSSGHPLLEVQKNYNNDSLYIQIDQKQDLSTTPLYRLPISLEIWQDNEKHNYRVVSEKQQQQFSFAFSSEPELVIFDTENQLLAEINYPRSREELAGQYRLGSNAMVRLNALENLLADSVADSELVQLIEEALDDEFWGIRQLAVNIFEGYDGERLDAVASRLAAMAREDPKSVVRADAITTLSSFGNSDDYQEIYRQAMSARSYMEAGAGLTAFLLTEALDKNAVLEQYEKEENINLVLPLADYYALEMVPGKYQWFRLQLERGHGELLYYLVNYFGQYLLHAAPEDQAQGTQYLEQIGLSHKTYYIRFSAYQALSLLEELPGVTEMKGRIKSQEKDPRLLEVYQQMP